MDEVLSGGARPDLPVDQDLAHPRRQLVRVVERRPVRHRRRVEHDDIGVAALPQDTAAGPAERGSGQRSGLRPRNRAGVTPGDEALPAPGAPFF
jgi:hypothetical protein